VGDRVVLLNSGGIDSRVSAAMLVVSGMEPHSLFIDWNPPVSSDAGAAARRTADTYCASHEVFAWPVDWRAWYPTLLKRTTPYANIGCLTLGVQYAQHLETEFVASGIRREVHASDDWLEAFQVILNLNTFAGGKALLRPVYEMSAAEVSVKARELGVDMDSTWSCWDSPQCGECSSCRRRVAEGLWLR
jgi:7-cyano-7-deazaguanine synthase in queuosine biosynthesis